ncbi:hypothetical protein ABK040_010868 [Willaertia magna]
MNNSKNKLNANSSSRRLSVRGSVAVEEKKEIKICVVGNPKSGKTGLILSFLENEDKEVSGNTLEEIVTKTSHQDKEIQLTISDTNGSEMYDRYRTKLNYPNTDVFIICYSSVSRQQFENVKLKWIPEVKLLQPNAKIVICCTKIDLRDDHKFQNLVIERKEGKELAESCKATYCECSVYDLGTGVKEVFTHAIKSIVNDHFYVRKK